MRCFACRGPWHPATGHWWGDKYDIVYCGPCYLHFVTWLKGHLKRKWGGLVFYEEAATSIRSR
jgi:hypothetical protein